MDEVYQQIVRELPGDISFAFAYGSAAFAQSLVPRDKKDVLSSSSSYQQQSLQESLMLDLILVVKDAYSFHCANFQMNPSHYSFLKYFGPKTLTRIQRNFKANIYFNVVWEVSSDDLPDKQETESQQRRRKVSRTFKSMKYGVIEEKDLVSDLRGWKCLYVSGRLHKPVHIIIHPDKQLSQSLERNRVSAVSAAILLLPESFSEMDLFVAIAGLSYMGDFRMIIGEDRHKVLKIVSHQMDNMRSIYLPIVNMLLGGMKTQQEKKANLIHFKVTPTRNILLRLLSRLPTHVLTMMGDFESCLLPLVNERSISMSEVKQNLAVNLKSCLSLIVWQSSLSQGIKGLFSTGLLKAVKYISRKLSKMIQSLQLQKHNNNISKSNVHINHHRQQLQPMP